MAAIQYSTSQLSAELILHASKSNEMPLKMPPQMDGF
jgi:hypothetical protein